MCKCGCVVFGKVVIVEVFDLVEVVFGKGWIIVMGDYVVDYFVLKLVDCFV